MPVSPDAGSRFAAPVADLLSAYELKLLETAAAVLRGDQDRDGWEAAALARLRRWRAAVAAGLPGATRGLDDAVRVALAGAAQEGAAMALADLPGRDPVRPYAVRGFDLDAERLGKKLASAVQNTPTILERIVREGIRAGVDEVRQGAVTRRTASQRVLNRLVRNGVTGFRDTAGRNWSLVSYAEMSVRTETQTRALAAGEDSYRQLGLDLVIVSDSPRECPMCRPFEGKVLSLSGENTGTVTLPNELGGPPVTIQVMCSIAQARSRGFQHPNCTHAYGVYIPGVTRQGKAQANPEGYEQKQRQRYMERKIREWKRAEAVALDPQAQAQARAKVREWQGQLREYVKANDLKRQPGRESITRSV